MSEDREQTTPGPAETTAPVPALPRRSPTRTGTHRAPDHDGPDEGELTAILRHLHTKM